MGLLTMHIIGNVTNKEEAEKISENLRTFFPNEEFTITASYREELNTDKIEQQ